MRAIALLVELLGTRREELLHDAWTLRSLFSSKSGPFRRAGFAASVVVRACAQEMDRIGTLHTDPLNEAFFLICEAAERKTMLNHEVVDTRCVRVLCANLDELKASQRRAVVRLLALRTRNFLSERGGPATNLFLLGVLAGGIAACGAGRALDAHMQARFPQGLPFLIEDEVRELLLPKESRDRLDERALALDVPLPMSS